MVEHIDPRRRAKLPLKQLRKRKPDRKKKVQVNSTKKKKITHGQYAQHRLGEKIKKNMRNALRA